MPCKWRVIIIEFKGFPLPSEKAFFIWAVGKGFSDRERLTIDRPNLITNPGRRVTICPDTE